MSRLTALLAFLGLTAALFARDLLGSSNLLINQGLPAGQLSRVLLFQLIPLANQTAPFAIAIGLLVGLGRLSGTLELTAMESCGVTPRRLLWPVWGAGCLGTALAFALSFYGVPYAARGLANEIDQIAVQNPTIAIQAGVTLDFSGWKLEAREASADGRNLRGVLLFIPSVGDTIFAERGRVETQGEGLRAVSLLFLESGAVLRRAGRGVERIEFQTLETQLPRPAQAAQSEIENPLRAEP